MAYFQPERNRPRTPKLSALQPNARAAEPTDQASNRRGPVLQKPLFFGYLTGCVPFDFRHFHHPSEAVSPPAKLVQSQIPSASTDTR